MTLNTIGQTPKTITTSPELQIYVEHFGEAKDDKGLVAEVDDKESICTKLLMESRIVHNNAVHVVCLDPHKGGPDAPIISAGNIGWQLSF